MPRPFSLARGSRQHQDEDDSPVMNETLSVIDEHITDMSTPRQSLNYLEKQGLNDSASEYSSQVDPRVSYITGNETDEEEDQIHWEGEVSQWSCAQVAEYLRGAGVEGRHCEVFAEQEITGEVLLGMDQPSIFIKEFELGSIGRRLRTWQIIKSLQEEVKHRRRPHMVSPSQRDDEETYSGSSVNPSPVSRGSFVHTVLPRIPSLTEGPVARQRSWRNEPSIRPTPPPKSDGHSRPSSSVGNLRASSPRRPSAASVREFNQSRRHSSIDCGASSVPASARNGTFPLTSPVAGATDHKKQASFDRNWTMSSAASSSPGLPLSARGDPRVLSHVSENPSKDVADPTVTRTSSVLELDRGYVSGGELDGRRGRNVLKKRENAAHSRNSSYNEEPRHRPISSSFRHLRFGSADSIRGPHATSTAPTMARSPAAQAYYGRESKDGFRRSSINHLISPPLPPKDFPSPTVTNLEANARSPGIRSSTVPSSPLPPGKRDSPRHLWDPLAKLKMLGPRASSEAVTVSEKAMIRSPAPSLPSPVRECPVQSPTLTSSSTPSGSKSIELDAAEASRTASGTPASTPTTMAMRRKSKKETSAYTRGLEKKTPREQMIGCDYSGWMKKKNTNLMTTWKTRLFVLRGRRLSYYYSETDDREKGLIDISSHRVLPADDDRFTGFHATLTGATHSPTSPPHAHTPTMAAEDAAAQQGTSGPRTAADSTFIFKLVPPRTGLSRAVNFTKPTVHYFAVDNLPQGRLWMAALMKATISRDDAPPLTNTYTHKTISLIRAQQMRHRPPALMSVDHLPDDGETEEADSTANDSGLNIHLAGFAAAEAPPAGDLDQAERYAKEIMADDAPPSSMSSAGG
ncbi:MAG: polar growth protein [Phylliscum demangeonii]|nr:MAG: polar growth protein [Phylliscum demangeonii]